MRHSLFCNAQARIAGEAIAQRRIAEGDITQEQYEALSDTVNLAVKNSVVGGVIGLLGAYTASRRYFPARTSVGMLSAAGGVVLAFTGYMATMAYTENKYRGIFPGDPDRFWKVHEAITAEAQKEGRRR